MLNHVTTSLSNVHMYCACLVYRFITAGQYVGESDYDPRKPLQSPLAPPGDDTLQPMTPRERSRRELHDYYGPHDVPASSGAPRQSTGVCTTVSHSTTCSSFVSVTQFQCILSPYLQRYASCLSVFFFIIIKNGVGYRPFCTPMLLM